MVAIQSIMQSKTFAHPDETCPLGDQIRMPTLRARMGLSSKMDVGAYWTTAPGANYGLLGGEFKYAFLQGSAGVPAAPSLPTIVRHLTPWSLV